MDTPVCPNCGNISEPEAKHCSRCGTLLAASGTIDYLGARLRQRTAGRYRIGRRLGSGGMASVYEAWDSLDRRWAIKVLSDLLLSEADMVERFEREARTVLRLRHPHIVQLHAFEPHEDLHLLVLEFIEGVTLGERMADGEPLSPYDSLRWFSQLADALDCAHAQKVIHRDIKPDNVLLRSSGDVVITDFGIAKVLGGASGLTNTGMTMGTGFYMSPEQWVGSDVTAAADQYSLGVMFYEMIGGRRPFERRSLTALMSAHLTEEPPDLGELVADLPPSVAGAVSRMLSKDPRDRYPTLSDAAAEILEGWTPGDERPAPKRTADVPPSPSPGTPDDSPSAPVEEAAEEPPPASSIGEDLTASAIVPAAGADRAPPRAVSRPRARSEQTTESGPAQPEIETADAIKGESEDRQSAVKPERPAVLYRAPWIRLAATGVFALMGLVAWNTLGPRNQGEEVPTAIFFAGGDTLRISTVGESRTVRLEGRSETDLTMAPTLSTWLVGDSSVISVVPVDGTSFRVTGLSPGVTTLEASSGDLAARLVVRVISRVASEPEPPQEDGQPEEPEVVAEAPTPSLRIDPSGAIRLEVGEARSVVARTGSDPDGTVDWSAGDVSIIDVRPGDEGSATIRGLSEGRTVLQARSSDATDSLLVEIVAESARRIVVTPSQLELLPTEEAALAAFVEGARGGRLDRTIDFESRDDGVVTVDGAGQVRARSDGSTWVILRSATLTDSVRALVSAPAAPVDALVELDAGDGRLGITISFGSTTAEPAQFCVVAEARVENGPWMRSEARTVEAGPGPGSDDFAITFSDLSLPEVGNAERRIQSRGLVWASSCPQPPDREPDFTLGDTEACLIRYVTRDWAIGACGHPAG